jgi:excinuclease ABC subunit C
MAFITVWNLNIGHCILFVSCFLVLGYFLCFVSCFLVILCCTHWAIYLHWVFIFYSAIILLFISSRVKVLGEIMRLNEVKQLDIPQAPGCYFFLDKDGKVIYIGKAANLRSRVLSYWRKSANHTPAKEDMVAQAARIDWTEVESEIEALLLEVNLIKKHQPPFNVLMRDDKRFAYIKVSTEDEVPGVFVTRRLTKSGRFFGPFTSSTAVRETLKVIRSIWPYCTERKRKQRPCFYYQINRCVGVCGGVVSREEYMKKVINPIIWFLQGRKDKVIRDMKKEIRSLERRIKKTQEDSREYAELSDELSRKQWQVRNINEVLKHANVLSVAEKYAADVVELAKVLGLPKVPERIEGYDISNIFGREAVGSMVVFGGGEPDKSGYRKFKIKIGQGQASDVRMLKEVLERRFKRSREDAEDKEKWPLPDLIIVDGGKTQLNVAVRALKKFQLDIPAISVSKGSGLRSAQAPDKIFFPGEAKPLELSLASPALHIIKRVRDEAHRFAIKYHRDLRSRRWKE